MRRRPHRVQSVTQQGVCVALATGAIRSAIVLVRESDVTSDDHERWVTWSIACGCNSRTLLRRAAKTFGEREMTNSGQVTLSVTIPANDLPSAGKTVEIPVIAGLVALIENRTSFDDVKIPAEARVPNTLRYAAVNTASRSGEEVHAAINRRVNGRNVPARYTVCDRRGLRIVTSLRHEPLESVTCKQCRKQLVEDGVLDD